MKPTIKIRFTEPQIALAMRAHPNCNLDHLAELSFEFDQTGKSRPLHCGISVLSMSALGHQRPRRSKPHHGACPLYPRKRTCATPYSRRQLLAKAAIRNLARRKQRDAGNGEPHIH